MTMSAARSPSPAILRLNGTITWGVATVCMGLVSCAGQIDSSKDQSSPGDPEIGRRNSMSTSGPGPTGALAPGPGAGIGMQGGSTTPAPSLPGIGPAKVDCGGLKIPQPGPSPLRRLTRFEYNNTVRDLLGVTSRPADAFNLDGTAYGFDNIADLQAVARLQAEQFATAASELTSQALPTLSKILPCDPAKVGEAVCAKEFIKTFGRRAFRRPPTGEESDRLAKVYETGRAGAEFKDGIGAVLEVILQAPAFLYKTEVGTSIVGTPGVAALTSWELASRLSYLLWGTMPDDDLFRAAEAGQLVTSAQLTAQAGRMIADPRARDLLRNFYRQWMSLDRLSTIGKEKSLYPTYSTELSGLWRRELESFFDFVVDQGDGALKSILTSSFTFADAKLATFYGAKAPVGSGFQRIELDPVQRGGGILSRAGVLGRLAKPNQSSPVHRGVFVRENLLCQELPSPPANAVIKPPELNPKLTTRERFSQHSEDPPCSGCHRLIDPVGLGFENYDAIGQWRATENGKTVDSSGNLFDADVSGPFTGATELGGKLADSGEVRGCYALAWFRFAHGRTATDEDACSLQGLARQVEATGGNVKGLLVSLTGTDAFRFRKITK